MSDTNTNGQKDMNNSSSNNEIVSSGSNHTGLVTSRSVDVMDHLLVPAGVYKIVIANDTTDRRKEAAEKPKGSMDSLFIESATP